MGRDRARRARSRAGTSPVGQLEAWRDWRHDTAEFPVVDDPPPGEPGGPPRHGRPRTGVLLGLALSFLALALGGLTVLGVGPVAHLTSSGDGTRPATGGTTSAGAGAGSTTTPSATTPSATTPSAGTPPRRGDR